MNKMENKMNMKTLDEIAKNFRLKRKDVTILGHVQYDSNDLAYRTFYDTEYGKRVSDEDILKKLGIDFLRLPGQAGIDYIRSGKPYDLLVIDKHSHKSLKEIGECYSENPYIAQISRSQNPNTPIVAYWDGFVNKIQGVDVVKNCDYLHLHSCISDLVSLTDSLVHKIDEEDSLKDIHNIGWCAGKYVEAEHVFAKE